MERVRGPLFESSTGYFLLIPTLAFALQETLMRRVRWLYGIACAFSLSVTLLGLGSRTGYALFGLFAISCIWMVKGRQRIFAIIILAAVASLGAIVIFTKAKTDRLQVKTKDGRTMMHEAVVNILEERKAGELIAGSGLGSLWPWYLTEAEGGDLYMTKRYIRHTPYGILLYHPHSTVLVLLVELGLVGLLFLIVFAAGLLRALKRAMVTGENAMLAWGLLISSISIEFDLFLVRKPTRDIIWWILAFGLFALLDKSMRRTRGEGL
jgi:O-antigen ligase